MCIRFVNAWPIEKLMWYELRMGLKGLLVSFSIIENMYGDNNASSYQKQSIHVLVSNCLFDHFYAVQMMKKWLNEVCGISLVGFTQIIQSIYRYQPPALLLIFLQMVWDGKTFTFRISNSFLWTSFHVAYTNIFTTPHKNYYYSK